LSDSPSGWFIERYAKSMRAAVLAAMLSIGACVSSQVLIGMARAPILPDEVRLCLEPPRGSYQEIAIIDASSKFSWAFSAGEKNQVVVRRLKEAAARLGANAILLQDIADTPSKSIGAAASAELTGAHGTVELGVSGSGLLSEKFGRATAIWLEP
jgi:hypothetical protein